MNEKCPTCQQIGKSVEVKTPLHLLKANEKEKLDLLKDYFFCRTPDCPVVYFNQDNQIFKKDSLVTEVFQKESHNQDVYACYCFRHTRKNISEDVIKNDKSLITAEITKKVANKECSCEISNPQGSCCLGNVGLVVKEALKKRKG